MAEHLSNPNDETTGDYHARYQNQPRTKKSTIGNNHRSFWAMVDAIPSEVIAALTSTQLAALIDANWRLAGASKAIAAKEAIGNGLIWDDKIQKSREIGKVYEVCYG